MGILTESLSIFNKRASIEGPLPLTSAKVVEWLTGPPSATGIAVTEMSALGLSAVWDCVDLVSADLARTPLPFYRRNSDSREAASDHPYYSLLHDAPNPHMTAYNFKYVMQGHKMLRGNAFANIERDRFGRVKYLWPLRADSMERPTLAADGRLLYIYNLPNGERAKLTQDEVLHLRGLSPDGIWGYSPIAVHRETIGLGIAHREFGARFYANSLNPSMILQSKGRLSEEAQTNLRRSVEAVHLGLNKQHRLMILEEGLEAKTLSITPEDAQHLESMKFNRIEIASIYHVPAHKINELDRATFSNIEEQDTEYVGNTLDAQFAMWEQQLNFALLTAGERGKLYWEYNRNALVRATIEKRFAAYAIAVGGPWMAGNEARSRENMNSLPNLDTPLQPLNMVPAGTTPPTSSGAAA